MRRCNMAWEIGNEYREYIIPSLLAYTHEKADERRCLQREIAMELLRDQRFQDEDFNEEDFEGWDCMPLLEEVASRIDTLSNGGWAFIIDNGGWTKVPVCSYEEMRDWWG
jgi:hypothetical protein